jgi:hypothetical protein
MDATQNCIHAGQRQVFPTGRTVGINYRVANGGIHEIFFTHPVQPSPVSVTFRQDRHDVFHCVFPEILKVRANRRGLGRFDIRLYGGEQIENVKLDLLSLNSIMEGFTNG